MDEAARALVDTLREIAAPSSARLELTTYPFHKENGEQAKVAPHMDRVFPQAYSVANRQDKAVTWDEREGPGKLQRFSAARAAGIARVHANKPELGMGLPAYDQNFEGHTPIRSADAGARHCPQRGRGRGAVLVVEVDPRAHAR